MFSKVISCAVLGVNGVMIGVEADVSAGLPMFTMVGYLSSSVKEAGERVRTALRNSGYQLPPRHITINLSPANLRKDGSGFDLPVAVSVLLAEGSPVAVDMEHIAVIGELSLDGSVKPVRGVLSMVCHCHESGITGCIVPRENAGEAALVEGMKVYAVSSLQETIDFIQGRYVSEYVKPAVSSEAILTDQEEHDFADIRGQEMLKRGMEIAAAGFHNVLMTGAAGAGKSMLARCLPSIMPELSFEERLEITKIYSISGLLTERDTLITKRPFRAPHHTVSDHALTGGGMIPRPGEVSLAHHGVLFLDELPEFGKNVLEVLRQPLEDRKITISRVNATYVFPADFMLVAAMNPCPCGHYPDMKKCTCTPVQIMRYQNRISGPLLDRIDINMDVKPIQYEELFMGRQGEKSSSIRERVERARQIQAKRFDGETINFNAQMDGKMLQKYVSLPQEGQELMEHAFRNMSLSARGTHRILKLARTIADLDGSDSIKVIHLREAIFYRNSGVNQYVS
ncbi:MAG: YifB family Mg chelatase-like AAA ATPase [Wujia sp.]